MAANSATQYKRILYYSPIEGQFKRFVRELRDFAPGDVHCEAARCHQHHPQAQLQWEAATDKEAALTQLEYAYVNLLVMDLRWSLEATQEEIEHGIARGISLLETLDHIEDLEARYGFHRIVALVSGPDAEQIDTLIATLGHWGVGHVLRQRIHCDDGPVETPEAFVTRMLAQALTLMLAPRVRKTALCLAGGGITGIYYELGALKCLDDCLHQPDATLPTINAFDMYFGISAGAINCGILTAGYAIEEFMAALAGIPGGRIPPLDLSLMRLRHFNFFDTLRRLKLATDSSWRAAWRSLTSRKLPDLDALLLHYTELIGPPFHSGRFEKMLRSLLDTPNTTNDFHQLPRELYIGASDQDAKKHVLFGTQERKDVPISKAIQASLSIHPAFSAVEIQGRYYHDGAVTRTSNFAEAIRRDASLVLVLDPFLPFVSKDIGYTNRRGLLYNIDQDLRTVSYTRYENVRNWVLRKHPDVSSYTFVPSNRSRQLLSSNPMDHRPYLEIWRDAYLSTFRRISKLQHRMHGDLQAHGIPLSLDRAEAIAAQLEAQHTPSFADFFTDAHITIRQPPLSRQQ